MSSIRRRSSLGYFNPLTGLSVALTLLAGVGCTSTEGIVAERLRCVVDTSGSSIVLQVDTSITLDQPDLFNVAVDSRGEVYASPTRGGSLMHWSASGVLLPMIGSMGEGPGQFAGGNILPFVVDGDTLYSRDNHRHWVVYGPDHRFVRFAPLGPISASSPMATQFTKDGLILSSDQNGQERYSILLVDRSGAIVRRIRALGEPQRGSDPLRAAFAAEDGTFWVGPEIYSRGGYSVEQWDSTGRVVRSIRRSVPWFIADSLIRPFGKEEPGGEGGERPFLFPRVQQVASDVHGRLWVVTTVPKTPDARDDIMNAKDILTKYSVSAQVLEKHVEVFDLGKNVVIASAVFPYGFLLMPNARDAVHITEDTTTGFRRAVRLTLRLADSSGASCR